MLRPCRFGWYVSSPYRYSNNLTISWEILMPCPVSSPYRYSNNRKHSNRQQQNRKFQVLIGILTILICRIFWREFSQFQVLIGILTITREYEQGKAKTGVSSPYRYSNNTSSCTLPIIPLLFQVLIGILTIQISQSLPVRS